MKKPYTFKLDPEKVKTIKKMGIDLPGSIRLMIDESIQGKICPACNQPLKEKKNER